jgi:hypothetical protein
MVLDFHLRDDRFKRAKATLLCLLPGPACYTLAGDTEQITFPCPPQTTHPRKECVLDRAEQRGGEYVTCPPFLKHRLLDLHCVLGLAAVQEVSSKSSVGL